MNAGEARQLTKERTGQAIQPIMDHIYGKIRQAAESGMREITDLVSGLRTSVSYEAQEAVYAELRKNGFVVTDHPSPDPGHPCSRPYTTVRW